MIFFPFSTVEPGLTLRQKFLLLLAFLGGMSLCTLSGCPH